MMGCNICSLHLGRTPHVLNKLAKFALAAADFHKVSLFTDHCSRATGDRAAALQNLHQKNKVPDDMPPLTPCTRFNIKTLRCDEQLTNAMFSVFGYIKQLFSGNEYAALCDSAIHTGSKLYGNLYHTEHFFREAALIWGQVLHEKLVQDVLRSDVLSISCDEKDLWLTVSVSFMFNHRPREEHWGIALLHRQ